jgi:hypothetical protein
MASSIINSDDGSVSGTTGLKTTGGDDGELILQTNGADSVTLSPSAVVINESGADVDFRIESDTDANAFFLEGSSGNVGIGTTSPYAPSGSTEKSLEVASGGLVGSVYVTATQASTVRGKFLANSYLSDTGVYIGSVTNHPLRFETNNTERMRIDSSGNMTWKQSGSQVVPDVNTTNMCGDSGYGQSLRFNTSFTGTRGTVSFYYNTSTQVGSINTSTTSTSFNTASDYRLKEDWQPMSGSIDRLKNLNPVNFAWKIDGSRVDGFLAHEAAEVVPEAVTGEKDAMRTEEYEVTPAVLDDDGNVVTEAVMGTREVPDYQGIDQSKLVPLLTAALQEAVAKIEALETRIAALEG